MYRINFQVNENGLLSFLTEIPSFFNVQFPLDYPLLAALYSDVDCREAGEVWYRATSDEAVTNLASDWVEAAGFSRAFSPSEVFVATWERVGFKQGSTRWYYVSMYTTP